MAKLTTHAKDRIEERFGFNSNTKDYDFHQIGDKANNPQMYTVVRRTCDEEIREIVHRNKIMQMVIKDKSIVTVLPPMIEMDSDLSIEDRFRKQIHVLEKELNRLNARIRKKNKKIEKYQGLFNRIDNKYFLISFKGFLSYRKERYKKLVENT